MLRTLRQPLWVHVEIMELLEIQFCGTIKGWGQVPSAKIIKCIFSFFGPGDLWHCMPRRVRNVLPRKVSTVQSFQIKTSQNVPKF